jgi:hypothetical protein
MFSAVSNAQNKIYTPITSVTWSNTTSNYNGSQQTVSVVSVVPANATYYVNSTGATNVGDQAQSILYATNSYTGTFTSPLLTITPATLTLSDPNSGFISCNGFDQAQLLVTVNGLYSGDSVNVNVIYQNSIPPNNLATTLVANSNAPQVSFLCDKTPPGDSNVDSIIYFTTSGNNNYSPATSQTFTNTCGT